ncbi:MAG TPA: efflux transporter outer membrane subunit [Noviherbaspirillum sp.]|jgi:NodT family efflux transporter outer membrane factor (OMF) lipoprotein|uniref:efflux transporter outer membrane subunit n=1 Tax=Noviherbaspirillum sp. TaxID=1926288 RepID=UPI002F94B84B
MKNIVLSRRLAAAALVAGVLAGCNLAPVYQRPALPVPNEIAAAGSPAVANPESLDAARALEWIRAGQLRDVVALALTHNRDLRVAIANIERARAQYGIVRAETLPEISAQAQAGRSRNAADLSTGGQAGVNNQYTAQLGFASYEIDLWGRVRNLNEAALQAFLQSEENQRNVQLGLVADVASAWLTLAADMARLQLARDTLEGREKAFALVTRMHELGAASGLVLAQNQTTVEAARGEVANYTAQVARGRNALQLLVGGPLPPELLPAVSTLSDAQEVAALRAVPAALPSTVLLHRPDVQAAEYNLRSMQANIGAARAALFPSISLTGSIGTGSRELDQLFGSGNRTWSFVPLVRLPIFDGGANRANVRVAEANQRIAVSQYEKAVQVAFREASDVLADRAQWDRRIAAQQGVIAATERTFQLSEARFKAGTDDFLTVLDAQRNLYAAQQALITLRLAEQVNRVTLWKVFGGEMTDLPAGS